ncbi:MAG: hypothetical protein JKY85_02685 [Porticoccus sp.]|nr:hypothetical protein [Porticoccus sp.]
MIQRDEKTVKGFWAIFKGTKKDKIFIEAVVIFGNKNQPSLAVIEGSPMAL